MPAARKSFHARSFTHYFNDDAFGPLSVKLGVIQLLPGPEIKARVRHRHDHLMMNQQTLQVRIAVGLARAVMAIIVAVGRQLLQPLVDVGEQAVFGIVHPHAGCNMHCRYQNHSFANAAFLQRGVHLAGNVNVLAVLLGLKLRIFRVKSHTTSLTLLEAGVRLEIVAATRILLVEDEPPLLQLIEKYLQRLGFEVETHLKSFEALRSFEAAPDLYALVIADLGMPDMPGDTLLTRMLEIRPELRILVCSGSPFFIENLPDSLQRQVAFLQKPFLPKMLADAVQNLLAQNPENSQTEPRP
jgi:CheY-like chemotaxis protein